MKLYQKAVIAGLVFVSSTAFANDYITGNVGDKWSYGGNIPSSSITANSSSSGYRTYSDFANKGSMQVWSTSSHNKVYLYKSTYGSTSKYFANLGAAVGTTNTVPTAICSTGYTKIVSRNTAVTTPAGTFTNTVTVECGTVNIVFAKYVGIISISANCLQTATVGGTTYGTPTPTPTPTTTNIALTATASAELSYNSNSAPAINMIDGNASTYWMSSVLVSGQSLWVQLDWTSARPVNSLKVTWNGNYYAKNVEVWAKNGGVWTNYGSTTSSGSDMTVQLGGIQADAVKLVMKNANAVMFLSIKELAVY